MKKFQIIMLDTLVGPKPLRTPAGWKFDKTATHVWAALLREQRRSKFKLARDRHARDIAVGMLANILANAIGMASVYWTQAAKEIVDEKP